MYLGKIVEIGEAKEIFRHPVHPYTQALIEAVPVPDPEEKDRRKEFLAGEIGDSANPPMAAGFTRAARMRRRSVQSRCQSFWSLPVVRAILWPAR